MSIKSSLFIGGVVSLLLVGCGSSDTESINKTLDVKQTPIKEKDGVKEASKHAPIESNYKSDGKDIVVESSSHTPVGLNDTSYSTSKGKDIAKPIPTSKQVDIVRK